jgi:hypothetical protein
MKIQLHNWKTSISKGNYKVPFDFSENRTPIIRRKLDLAFDFQFANPNVSVNILSHLLIFL